MPTPSLPSFPASTSTSFDDLLKIKSDDRFVLGGYEYRALRNAVSWKRHGSETVSITADRREGLGWACADVLQHRPYVTTLDDLLAPEEGRAGTAA